LLLVYLLDFILFFIRKIKFCCCNFVFVVGPQIIYFSLELIVLSQLKSKIF
jgi:hypothetical protein